MSHLPQGAGLDSLAGAARAEAVAHARACPACRAGLLAADPVAVFALLDEVEIPETLLLSVSAGVGAALDRQAPRRAWLRPAAAWAAAAGLALGLLVPAAVRRGPGPPLASSAAVVPPRAERAGIEALRTPGPAQVLDLTVGDTQVVMIFDAELAL